jgi:hypothetical protein
VALLGLVALGAAPCGAENVDAPPDPPQPVATCPSPRTIAPTFYSLLDQNAFAGLAEVVQQSLAACTYGGQVVACTDPRAEPPPAGLLIGGLLHDLGAFSKDPPEVTANALPGQTGYCAGPGDPIPDPPNRLCLIRRSLHRLIAQRSPDGKVVLVSAFDDLQPLTAGILQWVDGTLPGVQGDHYAALPALGHVVRRCDGPQVTGLLHGLLTWLQPPHGQQALDAVVTLLQNPDMQAFLGSIDVQNDVGRTGFIALVKAVISAILRPDFQPADLDNLMNQYVYPLVQQDYPNHDLEGDLKAVVAVLDQVLDPQLTPNVLHPLQNVLSCTEIADSQSVILGATYDLLFQAKVVSLDSLLSSLASILALDPDGTLLKAGDVLDQTVAADADTHDALDQVLEVMLEDQNARKVVPVMVKILQSDVVSEAVGLVDVLFDGCGGAG